MDDVRESETHTTDGTQVENFQTLSTTETRNLLEAAKRSVPGGYRPDGPPLSFQFDNIPDQWLPRTHSGVQNRPMSFDNKTDSKSKRMVIGDYDAEAAEDGTIQDIRKRLPSGKRFIKKPDGTLIHEDTLGVKTGLKKLDKTTKIDKELERQLKKRERKLNKEKERMNKERMKELEKQEKEREKLIKLQQREEEKQKQQQERDQRKLERELEKERKAQERRKQQEDKKREKDLQKALAAQRKVAQKEIDKQLDAGPPDDLEIELEELSKFAPSDGELQRPCFPPIELPDAFPHLPQNVVSDVIMIWSFIQSFSNLIGVSSCPIHRFIDALELGQKSLVLSNIHMGLIRLIQADMEESHHLVLTQGSGGTSNFMDRAVVGISSTLDEALAWGFDVDSWRGHLNPFTWPEILRQLAISAGHGPKRLGENKERLMRASDDPEDVQMEDGCVYSGLKMPSRLTQGTVKAAAWHVLADVGPEGLTITEIATRIQKQGLRDLRTSKTPEATVAGALSRDSVFARVAPATYALQVVISASAEGSSVDQIMQEENLMNDQKVDLDATATEAWIHALTQGDYNDLEFTNRLEVLKTLCNMALDSPTIRACLEARLEREIAEQKKLDVEARAEKRARREQATEETQRRLLEMDNTNGELTPTQVDAISENLDSIVKTIMTESLQQSTHGARSNLSSKPNESLSIKAQNHVRFEPLGFDRRFNRYWRLCNEDCVENDENCIFIEIEGVFKVITTQEALDELMECLNRRGIREGALHGALRDCSLPFGAQGASEPMEGVQWERQVSGVHLFANKVLSKPPDLITGDWIDQLKINVGNIEAALAMEMKPQLNVNAWRTQLDAVTSLDDILSVVGKLEQGLAPEAFHTSYRRQPMLLYGAWRQSSDVVHNEHLYWLPPSFAAIYLHLCSLDASLYFTSGGLSGRETLMAFKYVQKPFARDLDPVLSLEYDESCKSYVVSVEPISSSGALFGSAFPVLQKSDPVHKTPVPFSFEIDAIRESVELAERNGTLYASFQVHRGGRASNRQNGVKSINTLSAKAPSGAEDEASNEGMVASSEDQEMPDNVTCYEDASEHSTDGFDTSEDDEDYRL
eukprot:g4726.t1